MRKSIIIPPGIRRESCEITEVKVRMLARTVAMPLKRPVPFLVAQLRSLQDSLQFYFRSAQLPSSIDVVKHVATLRRRLRKFAALEEDDRTHSRIVALWENLKIRGLILWEIAEEIDKSQPARLIQDRSAMKELVAILHKDPLSLLKRLSRIERSANEAIRKNKGSATRRALVGDEVTLMQLAQVYEDAFGESARAGVSREIGVAEGPFIRFLTEAYSL